MLRGGREALAGNARAAIETWRPLLASAPYRAFLPYSVFERAKAFDLAGALNEDAPKRPSYGGISSATCREAERLALLGDHAGAEALAVKAIAAWSRVDVEVPRLKAMHAIVGH